MPKGPCLFHLQCGGRTAKGEHVFPASLGGMWKSSTLLCGSCQKHFGGGLDQVLPNQFRTTNTLLGVCSDHESVPALAPAIDPETGDHYFFDHKFRAQGARERLVSEHRESETTIERRFDVRGLELEKRFLKRLKREAITQGFKLELRERTERKLLVARPPEAPMSFGEGEDGNGFRAAARVALNFLAQGCPEEARDAGLTGVKAWIYGTASKSAEFGHFGGPLPEGTLPPLTFDPCHRVIIGIDGATGDVFGRIEFFDAYDVAIRFGRLERPRRRFIAAWDINPLATRKGPGFDHAQLLLESLAIEPQQVGAFAADADSDHVITRLKRLDVLHQRARERVWEEHLAGAVLPKLNRVAGRSDVQAIAVAQDALGGSLQHALELVQIATTLLASWCQEIDIDAERLTWLRSVASAAPASIEVVKTGRVLAERVLLSLTIEVSLRLQSGPLTLADVRKCIDGKNGIMLAMNELLAILREDPRWAFLFSDNGGEGD